MKTIHMMNSYQQELDALSAEDRFRHCRVVTPDEGALCVVEGRSVVNFSSNNYLGLAQDPRLKAAAVNAIEQYGVGSGAARLISGTNELYEALEEDIARFKSAETALVFNSGYQANVGLLQALVGPKDWVFCDKLNHASLVDGCLLSGARWTRYRHLDLNHLEDRLRQADAKASPSCKKWIVTDSLFSMDGDSVDLQALVTLAEQYGAALLVDEAHATGVYGSREPSKPSRNSGLSEYFGVSQRVDLQMGTLSKGLGGFGAYVAGSKILIDTLVNRARSFIFSTALPPPVIGAAIKAVELVQTDESMKQALWDNVACLRRLAAQAGLPLQSESPVFPLVLGDAPKTMAVCRKLLEAGYFVQGIRPPTVPEGTARLRITLSAAHTPVQIEGLVQALGQFL